MKCRNNKGTNDCMLSEILITVPVHIKDIRLAILNHCAQTFSLAQVSQSPKYKRSCSESILGRGTLRKKIPTTSSVKEDSDQ